MQLYFIDTNIWFYAFVESSNTIEKTEKAQSVIHNFRNEIVVSTQVINELSINLIKKAHFAEKDMHNLVSAFYIKYQVVEINQTILQQSSVIRQKNSLSFWDSLIATSALFADCRVLFSEDMQNNLVIDKNLKIRNPF